MALNNEPFDGYFDLLDEYGNEYLGEILDEGVIIPMEEFDTEFQDKTPSEIAMNLFFGGQYAYENGTFGKTTQSFNPNHEYFAFDAYDNPYSIHADDRLSYLDYEIDKDYFIEWCRENGYLDNENENDEEE